MDINSRDNKQDDLDENKLNNPQKKLQESLPGNDNRQNANSENYHLDNRQENIQDTLQNSEGDNRQEQADKHSPAGSEKDPSLNNTKANPDNNNNINGGKYSGSSKFTATTLGTVLIILFLTIVSVGIYAPIKDYAIKADTSRNVEKYLQSHNFSYTLSDLTRYLTERELLNQDFYDPDYENLENIKYYFSSPSRNLVASNLKEQSPEEAIAESQFALRLKIDQNGKPTIESSLKSFSKNTLIGTLDDINFRIREEKHLNANQDSPIESFDENNVYNEEGHSLNYLSDLEIVYTVPKELADNNDLFMSNVKNLDLEKYIVLILIIGGISILVLTVLALSIPYSSQKRAAIVGFFNKMYLEFKGFVWLMFLLACGLIMEFLSHTGYNNGFNYADIILDANWYFYLIGIPITFIFYTLIYLSIVYLKHIYHTGLKEGLIKNSILGKIFFLIINSMQRTVDQLTDVELTKEYKKKLMMILAVNFLALSVIALTSVLGLFLALIYTVFLFNYLIKIVEKVRTLNEAGSQLAKGNFDLVLPEDMGLLSPFAKSLNNIKKGFKIAVEEEVKSQNMKTQLISNVSHDLKTPLTSIITYVDLLKNEDLGKEAQKEYIDILDKKSKRLQVLIDDLFEASKASSGNIELHLEQVDVIALLRQTLGEMEEKINESTLKMRINLPEKKVICRLDGTRTYRIFENIIGNILKYSMTNSRVYIDVEEAEKTVSLIFKNISAYEMNFDPNEIMERFTRGDKSRNTEGSGLGLAIAKSLAELQKGNLDINIDGDLFKLTITFPKV